MGIGTEIKNNPSDKKNTYNHKILIIQFKDIYI